MDPWLALVAAVALLGCYLTDLQNFGARRALTARSPLPPLQAAASACDLPEPTRRTPEQEKAA